MVPTNRVTIPKVICLNLICLNPDVFMIFAKETESGKFNTDSGKCFGRNEKIFLFPYKKGAVYGLPQKLCQFFKHLSHNNLRA